MSIKESFERVGFTPEEKMDLIARLEQAAEQEDIMTNATKRKIKKISGGMVFGIAAAVIMTAGALAATISPGLHTWFNVIDPGASEVLESGIYRLDRSETYNGWTFTLGECVGDDSSVYIQVEVTAPEGTSLALREDGYFSTLYMIECGDYGTGGNLNLLPDEDPNDNHLTFLIQHDFAWENLRGKTVDIEIKEFVDCWVDFEAADGDDIWDIWHEEGTEMTAAIRDHIWVFEDVTLDFPEQTIRMEPNVEVPWLDGTTTLTRLDVSPFSVTLRVEGGSCAAYADYTPGQPKLENEKTVTVGGITIVGGNPVEDEEGGLTDSEMEKALTLELTMRDGTVVPLDRSSSVRSRRAEGIEGPDTPYMELGRRCAEYHNYPSWIWDPAQVDHVTVCGVDIPVNPVLAEN